MIPNAITIAGSDSGGGAGIQADLKTFGALGIYGASVITAVTAQNTREVLAIHDVPVKMITDQINAVFDDIRIDAVKIGMLSRPAVIEAVVGALERHQAVNVVLDPVMVAKSGDKLLDDEAIDVLRERMIPMANVITPNLPEAAVLLQEPVITTETSMAGVCERLLNMGAKWVVLKGGHLDGTNSPDLLMNSKQQWRFDARRILTGNTHGTGCTLSSAIASFLARGYEVPESVSRAKRYLQDAVTAADCLEVGKGHGPVHHFTRLWGNELVDEATNVIS